MRAETIAERLRGQAETWRGYLPDDTLWDMSDHQFTESVLMAFGLDDMDMHVHEAFDKLADMIDRPTTTRHGKFKTKYGRQTPLCEVCGYSIGDMRWNHCPKCGAVITDD